MGPLFWVRKYVAMQVCKFCFVVVVFSPQETARLTVTEPLGSAVSNTHSVSLSCSIDDDNDDDDDDDDDNNKNKNVLSKLEHIAQSKEQKQSK